MSGAQAGLVTAAWKLTPAARGAVFFALVSWGLAWLVQLAYPFGIATAETPSYLVQGRALDLWHPAALDWWRTPGYPLLLRLACGLERPDQALYALNAGLFGLNVGLTYGLGHQLGGPRWGWILGGGLLIWETSSLQLVYLNRHLTSDPVYAELTLLAVLLACLSRQVGKASLHWLALACGLMGLAVTIRPAGTAALPLWLPWLALHPALKGASGRRGWLKLVLLAGLCWGPHLLWCTRNLLLYGYFSPSASAHMQFFRHAHFVIREGDLVFQEPELNRQYFAHLQAHCQRLNLHFTTDDRPLRRSWEQDTLFPWTPGQANVPFDFMAAHLPSRVTRVDLYSPHPMFAIERDLGPVARRILVQHPWRVLQLVGLEYRLLYSWHRLEPYGGESFSDFPPGVYGRLSRYLEMDAGLYGSAWPLAMERCNLSVARALGRLRLPVEADGGLAWLELSAAVVAHLFALLCAVSLFRRRGWVQSQVGWSYLLIFGSVAPVYLATAILETARYRYAMGGALMVKVAYLLAALELTRGARRRVYKSDD